MQLSNAALAIALEEGPEHFVCYGRDGENILDVTPVIVDSYAWAIEDGAYNKRRTIDKCSSLQWARRDWDDDICILYITTKHRHTQRLGC